MDGSFVSQDATVRLVAYGMKASTAGYGSNLTFSTTKDGISINEAMRIDENGRVGIGVLLPGAKLDVNGNANISGTIEANVMRTKTITKTLLAGASVNLLNVGTYSSPLVAMMVVRSTPPASGRLTQKTYFINMMGSG